MKGVALFVSLKPIFCIAFTVLVVLSEKLPHNTTKNTSGDHFRKKYIYYVRHAAYKMNSQYPV